VPGSFGTTAKADGVKGVTSGKNSAGVFGENTAKAAPTGGGGGAGVLGVTASPTAAGITGSNTHPSKGSGVHGHGPEAGVSGFTDLGAGLRGESNHGNGAEASVHDGNGNGLLAVNDATAVATKTDGTPRGCGVVGVTAVPGAAGLFGANNASTGVGLQANGPEVGASGFSSQGAGVKGLTNGGNGVEGFAIARPRFEKVTPGIAAREVLRRRLADAGGPGALARKAATVDVVAAALQTAGDIGLAHSPLRAPAGVVVSPAAVVGAARQARGPAGNGVWGHTNVAEASGVFGSVDPRARNAAGVTGVGPLAGRFFGSTVVTVDVSVGGKVSIGHDLSVGGDVRVTGDVILAGADIAEDFDTDLDAVDLGDAEPGTVMVISPDGSLRPSDSAYDTAVAGVVSAAGELRPGLVLDRGRGHGRPRVTLALVGKVFCWAEASEAPIRPGDLVTTSSLRGHAMRATNAQRAAGAVLGKALRPLSQGQALIPILVALQ